MDAIFLSHASEDAPLVAAPLAAALRAAGVDVWLDADDLAVGDSLARRIDQGLLSCRFGVVVLSPRYFAKSWTRRELDALLALETRQATRLLPVLHDLDIDTLTARSPMLAGRVSISTSAGISVVVRELLRSMGRPIGDDSPSPILARPKALVGSSIGRYRLDAHLGGGGSGVVFAASDLQQRSRVAVKIFFPLREGYRHLHPLFDRGFRALRAVRHPSVISVIDSGVTPLDGVRTKYLVTELIDGPRLDEWTSSPAATYRERLCVAWKLAEGLSACHDATYVDELGFQTRGLLHGDIKPANVLIDAHGVPRLLDFLQVDVQRVIDPPRGGDLARLEGCPATGDFGTPGFMPEEQERYGIMSPQTDVYAFGMTLAHLFTLPCSDPFHRFMRSADLPAALKEIVIGAVSMHPSQRWRTMGEIAAKLHALRVAGG